MAIASTTRRHTPSPGPVRLLDELFARKGVFELQTWVCFTRKQSELTWFLCFHDLFTARKEAELSFAFFDHS